jgi:hypothetical protein
MNRRSKRVLHPNCVVARRGAGCGVVGQVGNPMSLSFRYPEHSGLIVGQDAIPMPLTLHRKAAECKRCLGGGQQVSLDKTKEIVYVLMGEDTQSNSFI